MTARILLYLRDWSRMPKGIFIPSLFKCRWIEPTPFETKEKEEQTRWFLTSRNKIKGHQTQRNRRDVRGQVFSQVPTSPRVKYETSFCWFDLTQIQRIISISHSSSNFGHLFYSFVLARFKILQVNENFYWWVATNLTASCMWLIKLVERKYKDYWPISSKKTWLFE